MNRPGEPTPVDRWDRLGNPRELDEPEGIVVLTRRETSACPRGGQKRRQEAFCTGVDVEVPRVVEVVEASCEQMSAEVKSVADDDGPDTVKVMAEVPRANP